MGFLIIGCWHSLFLIFLSRLTKLSLEAQFLLLDNHGDLQKSILSGFLFEIGEYDVLDTEWSDSRFNAIVDHITVHNDGRLVFTFRNGSEEMVMM